MLYVKEIAPDSQVNMNLSKVKIFIIKTKNKWKHYER